eukprot:5719258-Pleurochrysis_carterae.AAC.1
MAQTAWSTSESACVWKLSVHVRSGRGRVVRQAGGSECTRKCCSRRREDAERERIDAEWFCSLVNGADKQMRQVGSNVVDGQSWAARDEGGVGKRDVQNEGSKKLRRRGRV